LILSNPFIFFTSSWVLQTKDGELRLLTLFVFAILQFITIDFYWKQRGDTDLDYYIVEFAIHNNLST